MRNKDKREILEFEKFLKSKNYKRTFDVNDSTKGTYYIHKGQGILANVDSNSIIGIDVSSIWSKELLYIICSNGEENQTSIKECFYERINNLI